MLINRRALLFAGASTLLSPWASAQSGDAQVAIELVLFRHAGADDTLGTARLAPEPAGPATTSTLARVTPLSPSQQQLAGTETALRRSGLARLVARTGWTQVVPAGSSLPVRVEELPGMPPGLRGIVALERGQYLTLRLDLRLEAQPSGVLSLRERRRIRYNERNYFDHPVLGAIVLVSPVRPGA